MRRLIWLLLMLAPMAPAMAACPGTPANCPSPTLNNLTVLGDVHVTGSFTATGLVTNADLVSPATTVNGQTCTLGAACTITASAGTVTIGTTTVASGTTGRVLYDNAGILGELAASTAVNGQVCALGSGCTVTAAASSVTINTTSISGGTNGRLFFDNNGTIGEVAIVSGGILGATSGTAPAYSAALTNHAIVLGGGAGAVPAALGSLGTTTTVLHGNAAGDPTFGAVANADLVNAATTVNGQTCTLGAACTITASAGTVTVGTTTVAGGTDTKVLFNNAGTLGQYTVSGSGNVALTTSPTFTTPVLGTPTSGVATNLTNIPVANALAGSILPAANGGAGTINGALKGNGSGTVSQAACSDLSNGATGCSTATGTSGATIPLLNASNVWSNNQAGSITTLAISTATFTPDATNNHYKITLVHASCPCTLANPSPAFVAGTSGVIEVIQSATGSDTIGTYGSSYIAPGGTASITLSTGANAIDVLAYFVVDATHIMLVPSLNFSH